jgi:activator of 2-hydroxyglutaryl-CoA dehydratase/predicted nucleotide-binding protein (sugar kinase/HSP70/actin superfamily)
VGSTTVKLVVLSPDGSTSLFSRYEKHRSDVRGVAARCFVEARDVIGDHPIHLIVTGSGGFQMAEVLQAPYMQEVVACSIAIEARYPETDVAIELGGEDAKVTFRTEASPDSPLGEARTVDMRMNSSCAGGTGAFADQMASLLATDTPGLNELALRHKTLYPVASRCGVFAKSDLQPLLNEGAAKEDIAASIFQAIVNQTITGLACGTPIKGTVLFLGGPLFFLSALRDRFVETLKLAPHEAICPDDAQLFVAMGAALSILDASGPVRTKNLPAVPPAELFSRVDNLLRHAVAETERLPPLFSSESDYEAFIARHDSARVPRSDFSAATGPVFVGIDAGSTTTKVAIVDPDGRLLYTFYGPNNGSPLDSSRNALVDALVQMPPTAFVAGSCVTGYGEALLCKGLKVDYGEVETIAHTKAAEFFLPRVDTVLDIGGADMKLMTLTRHVPGQAATIEVATPFSDVASCGNDCHAPVGDLEDVFAPAHPVKEAADAAPGTIDSVTLNEACSSGCGSFISTFAQSLGMTVQEFAAAGLTARAPVDLGSKCTVFFNSRVKQAQKEGATLADISAGIALSVIKNAMFKVIRLRDPSKLGKHIVVTGGTFFNDCVLRSFENILGAPVIRPDIAGVMGAFGAALIARSRAAPGQRSTLLPVPSLRELSWATTSERCGKCSNNCMLTVNTFAPSEEDLAAAAAEGRTFKPVAFISGNRCERGSGEEPQHSDLPDIYKWKYRRAMFGMARKALRKGEARFETVIGLPRCLNMIEDYPFWHALWTDLGFRVVGSARSSKQLYDRGMHTISSDTVCYPAKLAHGHVQNLIDKKVDVVWYPCIPYNADALPHSRNHYNCPVVASYPEAIRQSMHGEFEASGVRLMDPFLPMGTPKRLIARLCEELLPLFGAEGLTKADVKRAVAAAFAERESYFADLAAEGERCLRYLEQHPGSHGIVLSGRPYQIDAEINHGINDLIRSYGFVVLSEDSIYHLGSDQLHAEGRLRVLDQWTFHSRLYRAAAFVGTRDDLDMVQELQFSCGLDAVVADQVREILERHGKCYTSIKIDEVSNLGAARIRMRSLFAAISERRNLGFRAVPYAPAPTYAVFTKEMRDTHTIIAPMMAPHQFDFVEAAFKASPYNVVILRSEGPKILDEGLAAVHSDACIPAISTIGQFMDALKRYDPHKVAIAITQTGGPCRASSYVALIKKALHDAGYDYVPIIPISAQAIETQPGFSIADPALLRKILIGIIFGDLIQRLLLRTRPYELRPGSANQLAADVTAEGSALVAAKRLPTATYKEFVNSVVDRFAALPLDPTVGPKPRVGIVGEILVKFAPGVNNHLVDFLEAEGAEAVVPDLLDFFLYAFKAGQINRTLLDATWTAALVSKLSIGIIEHLRRPLIQALRRQPRFGRPPSIDSAAKTASEIISTGCQAGEGWLLVAETLELIDAGVPNVLCLSPFGCLPNMIVGRSMFAAIKRARPHANLAAIDYDVSASEVNQISRVKLMLATAFRRLSSPEPLSPIGSVVDLTSVALDDGQCLDDDIGAVLASYQAPALPLASPHKGGKVEQEAFALPSLDTDSISLDFVLP